MTSLASRRALPLARVLALLASFAAGAGACTVDTEGSGAATNPKDGGGGTSGTSSDGGGSGGAAGAAGAAGAGGSCFPSPDEKPCGNVCPKKTDAAYGCASSSCAPCEFPNATATCQSGQCSIAQCNADFQDCDGDPLDGCETNLQADPKNCSACGNDCNTAGGAKAWACTAGTCEVTQCDQGFGDCDKDPTNKCEVDLQTDSNNCGFCGNVCNLLHANAKCVAGQCLVDTCQTGWKNCDTANPAACEQDIATDANNCGDCGKKCNATNGAATCVSGGCKIACASGWGDCNNNPDDGCETNLNTTATACGACNTPCSTNHGTPSCSGAQCSIACAANFANCDGNARTNGCEIATSTDAANCGGCGTACSTNNGTRSCSGGNCAISCNSSWGNCDGNVTNGCERSLVTTTDCGGCNTACSNSHGTPSCTLSGVCAISCSAGWGNCDNDAKSNGCEKTINTTSDCGGCNIICSANHGAPACTGGACQIACSAGWANCDNNAQSNGCETNTDSGSTANCGGCNMQCSNLNGTPSCSGGNCSIACAAGHEDCDGNARTNGCEVNTNTDPLNCGGCTQACSTNHNTPGCSGGTCQFACDAGYLDCNTNNDGCETKIDDNHCGDCSTKCTGGKHCQQGGSTWSCQ